MRLTSRVPLLLVPLALAFGGCVTRTVYVVADDPRRAPAASAAAPIASAASSQPAAPDASPAGDVVAPEAAAGVEDESDFYEPLSPYGSWVAYPGYGQVFVPAPAVVGVGFRPYTHGHWEHTEWGYTWVDHHPFGWATGHYGRWFYDSSYGWVWVPGRVWAPAWVSWRTGGGYIGWAPMPPGAFFGGPYSLYESSWVFTSYGGFGVGYVGSALIIGPGYHTCYISTYPARETYVVYGRSSYRGPNEDEIVRGGGSVVHRPVREVERERAVIGPPQGTALSRTRTRATSNAPASASADGQADGARGSQRGREPVGDARDTRGKALDAVRDDGVGPRAAPGVPDDVHGDRAKVLESEMPTVVEPRPLIMDDVVRARGDDAHGAPRTDPASARGDDGPAVAPRDIERAPILDPRAPFTVTPDNVRPLTEGPDFGTSKRTPVAPAIGAARDPVASRGSVVPPPAARLPGQGDRSPAKTVGPRIERGPVPSRAPTMSPAPTRGPAVIEPAAPPPQQAQPAPTSKKKAPKKGLMGAAKPTPKG
jgi:hypothetical protein